jgi:hypothetical protein
MVMRMTGLMLSGVAALALTACNAGQHPPTVPSGVVVKAGAAVERAEQHYAEVAAVADRVLPYLPARQAERLRTFQAMIEGALYAARTATTIAGQLAAVREAQAATAQLDAANAALSLPPPDPG